MELRALIEKAGAGDVCAFTELVRRYQDMAFGYAFSLLRDFHLAEDATQDAFLAVYANLPALQTPEAFPGWLRGIVRHQCHRIRRKRRFDTVPLDQAWGVAAETMEPERQLEVREQRARILAAIAALPQPQREVVALYYIQEYSQQEIAAFLGTPVTTVNNRLYAARTKLKRRMLPMVKETLKKNALPPDFAERVGKIVQVRGPVVDAKFAPGERPPIFSALTLAEPSRDMEVLLEVAQHIGEDMARCIARSETTGLTPDMKLVPTGQPAHTPLTTETMSRVLDILGTQPVMTPELLETGIKAIDLFCPFAKGGRIGVFAEWGVGALVLLPEILHNLTGRERDLSLFLFVPPHTDAAVWQEVTREMVVPTGDVQIVHLTAADPLNPDFVAQFASLDARVYLTRRLAEQRLYPAIDPFLSTSRLLEPAHAKPEHAEIAQAVRETLQRYYALQFSLEASGRTTLSAEDKLLVQRARKLQRFLSQPFFVAEPYTKIPGKFVPLEDTLHGCRALLSGEGDALPADAFTMIGAFAEAEKAGKPS